MRETKKKYSISRGIFSFNGILGKVILLSVIFITTITALSVIIYYFNQDNSIIVDKVENERIPVPILTSDIISGTNQAAASQRAFIFSGKEYFKQERIQLWREEILPAWEALSRITFQMEDERDQEIIKKAGTILLEYQKYQDKIDQFYERELQNLQEPAFKSDSISLNKLKSFLEEKAKNQAELQGMISGDASRLLSSIRELLLPLNENQENLLREEVALINKNLERTTLFSAIAAILAMCFILWYAWQTRKSLKKSIKKPVALLQQLSRGILHEEKINSHDELNEIIEAGDILRSNLKAASRFALDIGDGKFDSQFQAVGKEDILGNSLLEMREQLKTIAQEEQNRHWINEGQAQLDVLLRQNELEEKAYYNQVLSFLMRYVQVNQGALFLVRHNDGSPYFEMISCMAYERNKFIKRTFDINEGFVGQVYYEKQELYLEDLPDAYYKITSGLGELSPKRLLFYPLIFNDEVEGVIELTSVTPFTDLQLEFIKKISDSMASSIANHKNTYKTISLLADSQKLSEELKTSEEELRQNMEEMKATQEEMERRSREFEGKLQVLDSFGLAIIEFTPQGQVYNCNQSFLDLMGYGSLDEITGKHHRIFVLQEDQDTPEYLGFWEELRNGIPQDQKFRRITKEGKEIYLQAYYGCIRNLHGSVSRIIKVAREIPKSEYQTENKLTEMSASN